MGVSIRAEAFEPYAEILKFQAAHSELAGQYGATASFVGTMRDFNQGDTVQGMSLEHYPGMTEKQLQRMIQESKHRWELLGVQIVHRVGELLPNDPIVLVAVWSAHRAAAFEACRWLMEELKTRAPFWKKEALAGKERWVETNTSGHT